MASHHHDDNPWGDQPSQQGQPYPSYHEPSRDGYNQQPPPHPDHDTSSPWGQEPGHSQPQASRQQQQQQQQQQQHSTHPPSSASAEAPPGLPPRRTATEMALPTGQDRSHQIEVMQSYEAAGRKDEDDANVEILQREFPNIDGSLIAAIYGDSKSLSATREMLQALE